ncbi:hypothetical protein BDV24DRAFT_175043 [Aspergillus arachidicola]|uniref:Tat pathway signal sequence domain-containing protein n=1 Tax=Aspergillus arachidicola TaxID=656916 RepID=A0A5N6Y5M7_9EURO|nr:hypothetical protein BDV24DRAFT_175043 [Aspergillus arachidicola]
MLSFLASPLLALAIGPSVAYAACPYAQQMGLDLNARDIPHPHPPSLAAHQSHRRGLGKDVVMLMNRIAPGTSELYISDIDAGNERPLLSDPVFEYHASFSPDGQWVLFTSERNGDGNSDIWRVHTNGSPLQPLVITPAVEDAVVLSPNGRHAAYVATEGMIANIWNLTNTPAIAATTNKAVPHGYFKPAWSPDSQWIAFLPTAIRNGLELSIFAIRPDETGFRKVIGKDGYALGSPSWSAEGKRIVYYEMTRETTWDAHSSFDVNPANSSIVSVDFATGTDRIFPQHLGNTSAIGYLLKGTTKEGIYSGTTYYNTTARSPAYWDANWTYRFTDVFPTVNTAGRLAITQKQLGDSAVISLNATGTDNETVFDPVARGILSLSSVEQGTSGAFQSSWSSDGNWLTYGVGYWFAGRASNGGWIVRSKADGSEAINLTTSAIPLSAGGNNTLNTGFPSFSPDGTKIVFRVWGADAEDGDTSQLGLRIVHLDQVTANGTYPIAVLTNWWDTLPSFSSDGTKIVFTRRVSGSNYEVCTIAPDGSDLQVLTSSEANDAHAVWSHDGRIMYSTGEYGFQSECALYDNTFQPYGQINIMDADGRNKRALTKSLWEDSMPAYVPGEFL